MQPIKIFYWEGLGLFVLAAVLLSWRAFLLRKVLAGLVFDEQRRVSVTQVQLLILSTIFGGRYLWELQQMVAAGNQHGMPVIGAGWLIVQGVSSGVYVVGKFFESRKRSTSLTS